MSANKLGSRSVAAVIAAIMALSPIGSAAFAATKQPVKRSVVGSKVSPAAKVPRQINRPPSLPTIQSRRNDNSGSGRSSTIAGKANNPAQRVPSMLPSASNELRERLKEPANGKTRALKPSAGTPAASVSGSARAELSSQIKAGVAGSAINTDRLSNIRDRVAGAGQFRDRVDNIGNSALQVKVAEGLTSQMRNDIGAGLRSDTTDVVDGIAGGAVVAERRAIMSGLAYGIANGSMNIGVGSLAGASAGAAATSAAITGAVGAAAVAGWTVGRAIDRATGVGGALMGAAGESYGDAQWNAAYGPNSSDKPNQDKKSSTSGSTSSTDTTQTTNTGSTGTGSASSNENSGQSTEGESGSSTGQSTASNGSGATTTDQANGGSCGDSAADSSQCTSSADGGGTTPAPTADSGSEGSPNPLNDTSTRGSIIASMALDRALGGNQTRQQEKDRAARTGGGVTTPFDGAETSNATANLAIDRQFNTGYASRQEDHLDGKQGGNVGQPGDDVNWNRNKAGKADLNDLNVVKAMQTGIKTPTVDQGNAGNKAPKAPTVGGGYTGGGGGTTASQAPLQGAAGVSPGTSAAQSVQSAVQTRLRNAMSSAAGQVREQANTVR
ncbi:MAG: hypothetical protein JNM30_10235 [Rhodospirillales bacterium]|nr:hypothetical protein [Rhodospirillales bacterium]